MLRCPAGAIGERPSVEVEPRMGPCRTEELMAIDAEPRAASERYDTRSSGAARAGIRAA
jgi:hypothetical protein